jgi:hypothetical protein
MYPNDATEAQDHLKAAQRRLWPDGLPTFMQKPEQALPPHAEEMRREIAAELGPESGAPPRKKRVSRKPRSRGGRAHGAPKGTRRLVQVATLGALIVTGGAAVGFVEGEQSEGGNGAPRVVTVEDLTVRGAIRIVDERGQQIAIFGRDTDGSGGREPLTLGMSSPTLSGPRETLRMTALDTGGTVSLKTPDARSNMTIFAGTNGPFIVLKEDERSRVISEERESRPYVTAAAPQQQRLPRVSAGAGPATIDLTSEEAQRIDDSFVAVGLAAQNGRVSGRIVNTSSVQHTGLRFALDLAGERLDVRVPMISPGNSTAFSAALPAGLSRDALRGARMSFVESTLRFHHHKTWGSSAKHRAD